MPQNFFILPNFKTDEELKKLMIDRLYIRRIKKNKPTKTLFCGQSGEGKSWSALQFSDIIQEQLGSDFAQYSRIATIHTPLDFSEKIDKILYDKEYKDLHCVLLDEASNLLSAYEWQQYLTQATNKILNQSRRVKPMCVFLVTQFMGDLTMNSRKSLTYYGICERPHYSKTKVYFYETYEKIDFKDLNRTKIGGRKIKGFFRNDENIMTPFDFKTFEMGKLRKEIAEPYERDSFEAKSKMIQSDLSKLMEQMKKKYGDTNNRTTTIIQQWKEKPNLYDSLIKRKGIKIKLKEDVKILYGLSREEFKEIETRLNEEYRGVLYVPKKISQDEIL